MPTLYVEDGSVVENANTFISLDDADTYHADRANTTWASAATASRQSALIRGTNYLCRHYKLAWKGQKYDEDQYLCWPRDGVYDEDEYAISATTIPSDIQWATCEAAIRELSARLDPDAERGGRIKRESVEDVIEIEYMDGASSGTSYPIIDSMLSGLLRSGSMGGSVRLVRT